MAEEWRDWKKIAEGQEANVASLSALVDELRAALREAEAQRDVARRRASDYLQRGERAWEAYSKQSHQLAEACCQHGQHDCPVVAEAAERKVDEYRQALDKTARFLTELLQRQRNDNDSLVLDGYEQDEIEAVAREARDALRVEQPRQRCECGYKFSEDTATDRLNHPAIHEKWVAEPEREGAER